MKKLLITTYTLALLLAGSYQGYAQQTQTLLGNDVSFGGFGGPAVKFSDVNGTLGVWVGGRGGGIIKIDQDHSFSLGGGGYALVTDHPIKDPTFGDPNTDYFAMNFYGGFDMEYTNRSYQLVHFTLSSLIGAGGLMVRDRNFDEVDHSVNRYFVFEPGANIEVNITHFFRISAGLSYRLTSGINKVGFNDNDFSGMNGSINLKFGKFQ
jgi:hypothetical protein